MGLGEIVIFKQRSNLAFTGLHKIQGLLENQLSGEVPEDTLLILASLPSLDAGQKTELLQAIKRFDKIIFWCYGDLIWNIALWQSFESLLQGKKVQWVVASQRWKNLASLFIPSQHLVIQPHPLNIDSLPNRRDEVRVKLRIKPNEKLLLYAGRRSSQKNLPWLIKLWRAANDKSEVPIKLAVAGPWCEYGRPQFPDAEQSMKKIQGAWTHLLEMYPHDLFDLGELSSQDVASYIQASDTVISLSTFLEEDYGLISREARTLGKPVVVTNWGGFADMQDAGSFLVDLQFEDSKLTINFQQALMQLESSMQCHVPSHQYGNKKTILESPKTIFSGFHPNKVQDLDLKKWQMFMLGLEHGS